MRLLSCALWCCKLSSVNSETVIYNTLSTHLMASSETTQTTVHQILIALHSANKSHFEITNLICGLVLCGFLMHSFFPCNFVICWLFCVVSSVNFRNGKLWRTFIIRMMITRSLPIIMLQPVTEKRWESRQLPSITINPLNPLSYSKFPSDMD